MMKRRSILCGLTCCAVLMTSCGIMPAEEQLPSAPIAKEVQEIEHVMTVVQKGDLALEDTVRCTYKPAKSEKLAFAIGGEYVETIYVEAGDSVKAGDLLAELDMGDLQEQLESQQYTLETLQMNKRHVQQQRDLALRRCNLQIQLVKEQLAELEKAGQTAAASAAVPTGTEASSSAVPEDSAPVSGTPESSDSAQTSESSDNAESSIPESSDSVQSGTTDSGSQESSTPESSTPESSTPESSNSGSSTPESDKADEPAAEPETPEEPQEPEIDVAAMKAELNQTLKSYNQNLTKINNQYAQQLSSIEDSIYIQGKKIAEMEQSIKERQIYAGIDGSVTFVRSYEEGAVSVEEETVFIIADVESSVFFVDGEEAELFNIGDVVNIEYNDAGHEAEVIDPKTLGLPEEEDGEIVRYLKMVQPDPSLEEGTKGEITVVLESREDVLYVKSSVIKSMDGKSIVYYLDESGLKSMKEVETGLDNGEFVEILSGLTENEEIIDE